MEPTQLQLVLNVVTITGMTSLAGYCYLLKKENRKLANERKADCIPDAPKTEVAGTAVSRVSPAPVAAPTPAPKPAPAKPAVVEVTGMGQEIRGFAAGRRTGWVNNLASTLPTTL